MRLHGIMNAIDNRHQCFYTLPNVLVPEIDIENKCSPRHELREHLFYFDDPLSEGPVSVAFEVIACEWLAI